MRDFVAEALSGEVIANIGQVDAKAKRALEREVKAGRLAKWRGAWFPVAGSPFGLLPFKTCYGLPEIRARFAVTEKK
jgi:hypothetical protein